MLGSMRISYRLLGALFVLVMLTLRTTNSAYATPPGADGRRLYAPCVACHQPSALGSADGSIPSLAGQQKSYLERRLAAFRSGERADIAMPLVAVHPALGDQQNIDALTGYLADLKTNAHPVTGSGEHLAIGQETYAHICAACHGNDGHGAPGRHAPRIAGQHFPYLRRQIESAANLHRDLAPAEMTSALRDWLNKEVAFDGKPHDFNRGDMLASGIVALLPLLEDAERRTGAKVESFNSVLLERELRAREE